ncbi:hypothetical protein [Phytohabitans rumicis]|uniref:Uncharacterized protein n=1 Tax=Phytohabitans rumicis TaxID=1076125 RepID=A0A6V8LB14_9ACTN|nr:hypothetical protein [Phytohabitans rumicis]GFJ92800.1 hypothetical protein Prum_064420 [Phytohabitans rumicis]
MTSKEQLIDLVEHLDEAEAAEVLDLLASRYAHRPGERKLPAFVGMGHSGQGDLGRRAKEIVRKELGGHAA